MGASALHNLLEVINASGGELQRDFYAVMKPKTFAKGERIHEAGEICTKFYFLKEGLIRIYSEQDDKDITCWFSAEGEVFTAIDSFFKQRPSKYIITAIEDTLVQEIDFEDLEALFQKHHSFEHIGRMMVTEAYVELVDRLDSLLFKTAKERYEDLLKHTPSLVQRVAVNHIASYIGVAPETMSRIRAQV